jgi:hypothetical protein
MKPLDRRTFLTAGIAVSLSMVRQPAWSAPTQRVWTFDNLQQIGGRPVTLEGQPKLVTSPWGSAVAFDGVDDAIFIDEHPLAGAATFTFEALFRPDGGAFEQRWFHLESHQQPPVPPGKGSTRMLFEIRVVENMWYLDAFMIGPGYRHTLIVPEKRFPIGAIREARFTHQALSPSQFTRPTP